MTVLLLILGCARGPSEANELCGFGWDPESCEDECVVVACVEDAPLSGQCSATAAHRALTVYSSMDYINTLREDCESRGGQWQQSELGTCPEMDSLDGAQFELEIGCIFPEE